MIRLGEGHRSDCACVPCLQGSGRAVGVSEAARLLGCKPRRVMELLDGGLLKAAPKFGRFTLIFRETIDSLLASPRDLRSAPGKPRRTPPQKYFWGKSDRYLRSQYGIDAEDWARLYERQRGKCPGCLTALTFDQKTHVDHCHRTGKVRGLLCNDCNVAVGLTGDSPDTLERLARYLHPVP